MTLKVLRASQLDFDTWRLVTSLYSSDPLSHAYLLYDLIYELKCTDVHFCLREGKLIGYVLVWRGASVVGVHVWGEVEPLLHALPRGEKAVFQLHSSGHLHKVLRVLENCNLQVRHFLDMVADESSFSPYYEELATRLCESIAEHVLEYAKLKESEGIKLPLEAAKSKLRKWRYYGVFVDGKLVSVACAYVRLPEVWIIGDVYTHPSYRGRGYAKIATSAITRDAVVSGAKAYLHVEENNAPAIRVYEKLGYKVLRKRPWVFTSPS